MEEKMKKVLCEIKYAAQEIINLNESIEKCNTQIQEYKGREKFVSPNYFLVRESGIKRFTEMLEEQQHHLDIAIQEYALLR